MNKLVMKTNNPNHDLVKEVSEISGLPLFFHGWWLDIVSEGKKWEYIISRDKKGSINGLLPLIYEKKLGFQISRMPPLTPFLGPWIAPFTGEKNHAKISHDQQIMNRLIAQMPPLSFYSQKFSPLVENWYPFYLNAFSQTTHYTFLLNDIKNHPALWKGLKNTLRTIIRNNENELITVEKQDANRLYALLKLTFTRQNTPIPFSESFLTELISESYKRNTGKTIFIEDKDGNTHTGLFIVWDDTMAYLQVLGMDDRYKNNGGVQILIWNTIKLISAYVSTFNFEGTMLANVEPVFRHFGGKKVPYSIVRKDGNKFIKLCRIAAGR